MMYRGGLILDRYRPANRPGQAAGEGISGVVIKAQDTWGEYGEVAIKRPNPMLSLVERRKKNAQIRREAEALQQLNHPTVCRYIDDTDWPNSRDHCLIIGWAEGESLEGRLRRLDGQGEILPLGEALEILSQLASLLAHAHEQGVIHNDLDAKHLFWNTATTPPRLTVIDWANCALSSDERPIATMLDDLQQYGELMHRSLTGSTLAYATRLGGEDNWTVEMAERLIPEAIQQIVARAVGRGTEEPYADTRTLYHELRLAQQQYEAPFHQKLTQIELFLEMNSTSSLDEAETLIHEVLAWNPPLVLQHQIRLQQLRRERAENLARIGGKASLLAEQWQTAQDEITTIFSDDISQMPQVEEKYIYLFAQLMPQLESDSPRYALGKEAIEALFKLHARNEDEALDKLLLLYGSDIPDYDPLIEALSAQTNRAYPIRNRIRQIWETLL